MSSSLPKSSALQGVPSSETFKPKIAADVLSGPDSDLDRFRPGSYDDASVIRGVLLQVMKGSGLSRESIAERMSYLLGRTVTEKMLNAFTAESRDDRRWPAEFDRAFCEATGDNTLLKCRAERAGLLVIEREEMDLLELGRAYLQRSRAEEKIARLQRNLSEVPLG